MCLLRRGPCLHDLASTMMMTVEMASPLILESLTLSVCLDDMHTIYNNEGSKDAVRNPGEWKEAILAKYRSCIRT